MGNAVRGEFHHAAVLTPEAVQELRRLYYVTGVCMTCAGKIVGCSRSAAFDAITYRTWRHLPDSFMGAG